MIEQRSNAYIGEDTIRLQIRRKPFLNDVDGVWLITIRQFMHTISVFQWNSDYHLQNIAAKNFVLIF
jgi:hypothetical protein